MPAKQKILIVDDDTNIAELISLYLTKEFYQVQIVEDGEQALQVFDTFQPNLVLLDLMLPGIDGYQVCRNCEAVPTHRSLCFLPKAKYLTRYLDWNWVQMII